MAEQSGAPQAEGPLGLDLSPVTPAEHLLSAALAPGGELYQPRPEGLFGHLLQTAIEPLQAAPAAAQGTLADRLAGLGNIIAPYIAGIGGAPRGALRAGITFPGHFVAKSGNSLGETDHQLEVHVLPKESELLDFDQWLQDPKSAEELMQAGVPGLHDESGYLIFHPSNLRIVARDGTPLTPVDHDPFAEGAP